MYKAIHAKYMQNPTLAQYLKRTGQMALVEATWDNHWAAGAHLGSPRIRNGSWMGQNNTGKVLMRVREVHST